MKSTKLSLVFLILVGSALGNNQCSKPKPRDPVKYPDDSCVNFKDYEEFDFVVVGAGPAGSAVARRLAECPSTTVLLLEAGGNPPPNSDIPAQSFEVGLEYRWEFESFKDGISCLGFTGDTCKYNPGKVLGGSSTVNQMIAVRGNPEDFEEWKRMGNDGWGYQDVLPYFKKLENFQALPITKKATKKSCSRSDKKMYTVSSTYHSTGGPLPLSEFPTDPKTQYFRQALLQAHLENGIKFNPDVNSNDQMGVTNIPGTIDELGYRFNAAKAYLLNIPDNLKVCKFALAHKVNLDTSTTPIKVTSVEFVHSPNQTSSGRRLHAVARKEYILSGGALNSPAILERSGIGIPEILTAAGVEPKLTLNVGENYQDQFTNTAVLFSVNYGSESARNPLSIEMTSLTGFFSIIHPKIPDYQSFLQTLTPAIASVATVKPSVPPKNRPSDSDTFVFSTTILRQGKFGSVHITQSKDPLVNPRIVLQQLTTQHDTDVTVNSTRLARQIMSHPVLKQFKVEPIHLAPCKQFDFNSEDEIMCGARLLPLTLYHQAGTCYMGPVDHPESVVDPELRVIGTKNLRVVDTSIMPLVTRGNTVLPAMMIGEKAADLIKTTWSIC